MTYTLDDISRHPHGHARPDRPQPTGTDHRRDRRRHPPPDDPDHDGRVRRAHGRCGGARVSGPAAAPAGALRSSSSSPARSSCPSSMARMAAPMLRDVDRLTKDRDRLEDLYGQAREDSLLDGLTGLGNHRAFQEELARQLELGDAPGHRRWRSCSSTSTTSRRSTTSAATRPATSCWRPSDGSRCARSVAATGRSASAATSSPCCSRPPTSRPA